MEKDTATATAERVTEPTSRDTAAKTKHNNKKVRRKLGKVNPVIYAAVYAVLKGRYTRKYGITFDNAAVKDIKGPAIVVATHTSDQDHILSALTLYPIRPTYIVSEHFIRNKKMARLLKLMHVITKKMFTPDVGTIMNVLQAKKENAVILIFPEGRLSCYGHTLPITEGTAELIKKLGVNLYAWKAEGAYLTFPKWREKGDDRLGKINCSVRLLLSADEVKQKEVSEIKALTEAAILHDDEKAMEGTEYRCADMTQGLDKILYKCPVCLREDTLTTRDNHIKCDCGLNATLDNFYKLHNSPFKRVNEWFEWQQASIDTENGCLKTKARLGTVGEDGFMNPNEGVGEIYMDKNVFTLSGVMHGERVEFTVKTEKIGAFPISPGDHFDIYHNGKLIYVYPEPSLNASVKWVCFLDKLNVERKSITV